MSGLVAPGAGAVVAITGTQAAGRCLHGPVMAGMRVVGLMDPEAGKAEAATGAVADLCFDD